MSEAKPLTAERNHEVLLQIEYLEEKFQCESIWAKQ
jgi:hypothetical protein